MIFRRPRIAKDGFPEVRPLAWAVVVGAVAAAASGQDSQSIRIAEPRPFSAATSAAAPVRNALAIQVLRGHFATGARVESAIVEVRTEFDWSTATRGHVDADGKIQIERRRGRGIVHARAQDGMFAAIAEFAPEDDTVKLSLEPCGELTGRLMSAITGKPLRNAEFWYGVRPDWDVTLYAGLTFAGGAGQTDEEGRFKMTGLVVGQKYGVDVRLPQQPLHTRTPLAVETAGTAEVGDVQADSQTFVPPPTTAAIAVDQKAIAVSGKTSWLRLLLIANLIGVPLVAIACFIWQRRA